MTSVAASSSATADRGIPGAWHRIWNVARVHFANRFTMLALPWIILGLIFAANLAIWIAIYTSSSTPLEGTQWSGGTAYVFVYFCVAAIQAMNLTFRFALGLGATRRDYYLGTVLAFLLIGIAFAVVYTLMSYVEQWTNGYGMNAHLFSNVYFGQGALWHRFLTVLGAFAFFFFMGVISGAVFVRWKALGLYALGGIVAILGTVAIVIVTLTKSWPSVGGWFLQTGGGGVVAWLMIPTVILAVLGYLVLRKAPSRT